jgi:WD40 repeat protein
VAFDSPGRRIVSGSVDKTVRVWDVDSGRELACLRGHEHSVRSVAFDSPGRRIVSGSVDKTVRVWDVDSGRELACLRGHERSVESVGFDPQGRRIVSGSDDGTVRIWDADSGACLEVIPDRGDIAAMAAGAVAFPYRAIGLSLETAIKRASDGQSLAWFPAVLLDNATHPSGRVWAGAVGNILYLIRLEGVEEDPGTMTGDA